MLREAGAALAALIEPSHAPRDVVEAELVAMGFFKTPVVEDPVLGRLERVRGQWRGALTLDGADKPVPLALYGSGREPDTEALAQARQVASSFPGWRADIGRALFDHYTPYAEAAAEEDPSAMNVPAIKGPEQVWKHARLQSVAVIKLGGIATTELAYAAAWDEDHILGARFQRGRLLELCGSI